MNCLCILNSVLVFVSNKKIFITKVREKKLYAAFKQQKSEHVSFHILYLWVDKKIEPNRNRSKPSQNLLSNSLDKDVSNPNTPNQVKPNRKTNVFFIII